MELDTDEFSQSINYNLFFHHHSSYRINFPLKLLLIIINQIAITIIFVPEINRLCTPVFFFIVSLLYFPLGDVLLLEKIVFGYIT